MEMQKNVLEQYTSIKKEVADLERMIAASNKKIKRYEKQVVSDTVTGTKEDMTFGTIRVEGIARKWIEKENELNWKRIQRMERFKLKLERMAEEVEAYIESIEDSSVRRIARFRYMESLDWQQVAVRMGKGYTADACRKKMERFLTKK